MFSIMGLGVYYSKVKDYEKALIYYEKALPMAIQVKDKKQNSIIYTNMGVAYSHLAQPTKALYYYSQSMKLKKETKDKIGQSILWGDIGEFYSRGKRYDSAVICFETSIGLAKNIGRKVTVKNSLLNLAEVYAEQKEFDKAHTALSEYMVYKDSLFNEDNQKRIASLEYNYEIDKKQKEILLLQKDKDLQSVENEKQKQAVLLLTNLQAIKNKELQLLSQQQLVQRIENEKKEQQIDLLNKDKAIQNTNLELLNKDKLLSENQIRNLHQERLLQAEEAKLQKIIAFSLAGGLCAVFILAGLLYWQNKNKQKANLLLQAKNEEIAAQKEQILEKSEKMLQINEEIKTMNEELNSTLDLANFQKREIEKQHEDITASITYAQRIQTAMLPFEERISKSLQDFFVFYQPRDIVSGDFYWFQETSIGSYSIQETTQLAQDNKVIIVAADCTGHGVPGAFMSMIGNELLNQIVNMYHITSPDTILEALHKGILYALKQEQSNNKDGMDIAIVVLTKQQKDLSDTFEVSDENQKVSDKWSLLEYAGAMNPLYLVTAKNSEILPDYLRQNPTLSTENADFFDIKATKHPIGGHSEDSKSRVFEKHTFDLTKKAADESIWFYLCSDGYQDQFGGEKESKFMVRKFKKLLFDLHQQPLAEQKQVLEQTFRDWKGKHKQVDDVLVMGVRL